MREWDLDLPSQLLKIYRDVFIIYLGPRPMVILCEYKAVREALVDQAEAFSGQGHMFDSIF